MGTFDCKPNALALIGDRIRRHLRAPATAPAPHRLAADLRDLLRAHTVGLALRDAAAVLHAHPSHLVCCFTRTYGLPPHRYLTGRRVEAARRRLLDGEPPADVELRRGGLQADAGAWAAGLFPG